MCFTISSFPARHGGIILSGMEFMLHDSRQVVAMVKRIASLSEGDCFEHCGASLLTLPREKTAKEGVHQPLHMPANQMACAVLALPRLQTTD